MKLTTQIINELHPRVNLKGLCRLAGVPYTTIFAKVQTGRELSAIESNKLRVALKPLHYRRDRGGLAK